VVAAQTPGDHAQVVAAQAPGDHAQVVAAQTSAPTHLLRT
jgi:hypothetical protein